MNLTYVFTKIMTSAAGIQRSVGLMSNIYLDDWLLPARSHDLCLEHIIQTQKLLTSLNFIINDDKSFLTPSKNYLFLGYSLDAENLQVSLPIDKVKRIKIEIEKFQSTT